jgi:predicted aldo/keto reductase-like oxidoreductase
VNIFWTGSAKAVQGEAMTEITRRGFVQIASAGAAGLIVGSQTRAEAAPPMQERPLGRTGHNVRLFSLGGMITLLEPGKHDEAVAIVNRAMDLGVNYLDTAAAYGNGISQTNIGEVMKTRRKEVFLATKTVQRTRDGAFKQLEESLRMLQTDRVDLWQLHNITKTEELDQIFGKDGAIEAMNKARDEKMVRFLGITGHFDPDVLIEGINRFNFDTILMALNAADIHYLSFQTKLLPLAVQKKMGIIAMKVPGRGRVIRPGGATMKQAMTYVWSLPVSTLIVGIENVRQVDENVQIAKEFKHLSRAEMAEIENLTKPYALEASYWKRGAAAPGMGHEEE